jgi:hypothetical protein
MELLRLYIDIYIYIYIYIHTHTHTTVGSSDQLKGRSVETHYVNKLDGFKISCS